MADFPRFPNASIPALALLNLTEDEQALVAQLQRIRNEDFGTLKVSEMYYQGKQVVENLRIAVPKELEFLSTIPGWGAQAVDPYVERLSVDGFRLPNATDADVRLGELWALSGAAAEQSLAYTDALALGRSYWIVGAPMEAGGPPLVTVESPLNLTVLWDLRGFEPEAAWQEYWSDGRRHAALYTRMQTIHLATTDQGEWAVVGRDNHNFGIVPIVRMANRPRTTCRDGSSEITQPLRNTIDSAARTLLGLEVAREIYSAPRYVLLGALESYFKNADGTTRTTLQSYMTDVWGLENDPDGNQPDIKQLQAYDPSTFTKLIDMYASQAAGILAAPPQDLGLYTQGNPTSAEAAQVSEQRRDRRARLRQGMFGRSLTQVVQLASRFDNGGTMPAEFERLAVDWTDVSEPAIGVIADAITKQVAAGVIPAESDVTLKRLGYNSVERQRLEQDRKRAAGRASLSDIANALNPQPVESEQEPSSGNPGTGSAGL